MVINSLADILNILSAFLSLFFAFYLVSLKSGHKLSNRLIALYLIVNAIDAGSILSGLFIYPTYPGLGLLLNTTLFLGAPLLYLYINAVTYKDFKLGRKHLWHLIPFIAAIALLIPNFYLADFNEKIAVLKAQNGVILEFKLIYLSLHLQIFTYLIACYFVILKSKKILLENYSNGTVNHYNWLLTLTSLIALEVIVSTFKNAFMFYELEYEYELAVTITGLTSLLFICWLVIKALKTPELYNQVDSKQALVRHLISKKSAKPLSSIADEQTNALIAKLKAHMETHEPYLDPSLSVYDLAQQLDLPTKDLSVLINHNLGQHFFDFINSYRIEKAMNLLANPANKQLTVLEILYQVGFNSKSSFNTAFKKYTKQTPTQFRKQYRS